MSVVTKYASGAYDPSASPPTNPKPAAETQGHLRQLVSTVELANGDSATSQVFFGRVPSNARISILSRIDSDAVTSLTDFDLGVGQTAAGAFTMKDADCLINGADLHSAGNVGLSAIDIADQTKALWQLAGYTDDPGGDLDIVGTLNAATTAAGTLTLSLVTAAP